MIMSYSTNQTKISENRDKEHRVKRIWRRPRVVTSGHADWLRRDHLTTLPSADWLTRDHLITLLDSYWPTRDRLITLLDSDWLTRDRLITLLDSDWVISDYLARCWLADSMVLCYLGWCWLADGIVRRYLDVDWFPGWSRDRRTSQSERITISRTNLSKRDNAPFENCFLFCYVLHLLSPVFALASAAAWRNSNGITLLNGC